MHASCFPRPFCVLGNVHNRKKERKFSQISWSAFPCLHVSWSARFTIDESVSWQCSLHQTTFFCTLRCPLTWISGCERLHMAIWTRASIGLQQCLNKHSNDGHQAQIWRIMGPCTHCSNKGVHSGPILFSSSLHVFEKCFQHLNCILESTGSWSNSFFTYKLADHFCSMLI